ncbi:NAD-dependent epimerase/dehydratase family protein [Candidatus Jettenia sp. AMX1]|uniref:NmrA family NAD(P)-binding protein n=1 Tax=Candidatus Jettenia sp. AMX1 TaxID=2293637 RepID=UPI00256B09EC|nr:NAD-dependent epimerase/dehydratase family protein [Candidatus Jettenia sp. AMX1]
MRHKTILITGATGFLGSYIARELSEAGFHLKLLVRKKSTNKRICTSFTTKTESS